MMLLLLAALAAAQPKTLSIATADRVGNFLSPITETSLDSAVLDAVSVSLVRVDFACGPTYRPELARDWSWSPDGTVLSMTLRQDMRFADGQPITARDVAFTYELLGRKELGSPLARYLDRLVPGAAPRVIDDHHLEWHFRVAYAEDVQLAHTGVVPILPAHVLQDVDIRAVPVHPLAKAPLASGPFQVADHEPGVRVVLEPNPTHAGGLPHLDAVEFRLLPDYDTRLHELLTDGVDAMGDVRIEDIPKLAANPDLRLYRRGWRHMDYVAWNLNDPLFADPRVRRALALAVDADALIAELLTVGDVAYGRRSVSTITPEMCEVHNDAIRPLPHDPAAAAKLLTKAGWIDRDGDGVRDRDGKPMRFVLTTNAGNDRRRRAAERIREMLAPLGVDVQVKVLDSSTFFHRLREREFQAAMAGWSAALFVDPSGVWSSKGARNFPSYRSDAVDKLIDRGLSEHDPRKANKSWRKMEAKVYEDQPYLFLYWIDEVVAVHRRVSGVQTDLMSAWRDLYRWRIDGPGRPIREPAPEPAPDADEDGLPEPEPPADLE